MTNSSAPNRLATAVRAARRRRGWSRERLAHESGLSFAAITQFETGRRTETRVSSLVALANALKVSVDYLVRGEVTVSMVEHRALVYDSPQQLAELARPLVLGGLEAGNPVLMVTTRPCIAEMRKSLGADAKRVTFGASSDWYTTPLETTTRYGAYARDARNAGADWVDLLGEPVWSGRSRAESNTWTRYESLLNIVFAPWPVSVNCLYDATTVPRQVRSDLHRTHPEVLTTEGSAVSTSYEPPEQFVTR